MLALGMVVVGAANATASPTSPPVKKLCPGCGGGTEIVPSAGQTFTGTQVVPTSGGGAQPIGAATGGSNCPDCSYRIVNLCELGNGCRELGGDTCPDPGHSRYAVYITRPGEAEESAGAVCLGPAEQPVPVAAITAAVERRLTDELIPGDAKVAVQPAGGALINIPTIVRADGARSAITATFFASGFSVSVTARPVRWSWTFGPGESDSFTYPGDAYASGVDPRTSGRHATWTYTRAGARQLQVVVRWEAEYTLAGVGTVPVGAIDRVSTPVPLQVYASRSELVAGS